MNVTTVLGFLVALLVIYGGVLEHAPRPELFLDPHALILVLGGTLAASLIAFPAKRLLHLFRMIFGIIFKRKPEHRELVLDIVITSIVFRHGPRRLANRKASHPFLEEGYKLIKEDLLSEGELKEVLQRRSKYFRKTYTDDAKLLVALAKFPPAFGLLGATSGMISMMTSLGRGGQETIGPAMAVALVATFWGIAMANLIFLPLADYTTKAAEEDDFTRQLIVEGLMLIKQKHSDAFVVEKLNGFLALNQRVELQSAINESGAETEMEVTHTEIDIAPSTLEDKPEDNKNTDSSKAA